MKGVDGTLLMEPPSSTAPYRRGTASGVASGAEARTKGSVSMSRMVVGRGGEPGGEGSVHAGSSGCVSTCT